jgi:hypothetical protein
MTIGRKVLPAIALIGATIAGGARATTTPRQRDESCRLHARRQRIKKKPA